MWRLRRLKLLDVHPFFYSWCICQGSQISGLTLKQAANIERVQRVAVNIILSDCLTGLSEYSYHEALELLELEPLDVRRERLCLSFAKKTQKSRHFDMFADQHKYDTRTKTQFYEQISKKTRFYNSPSNYLTRLLNRSGKKNWVTQHFYSFDQCNYWTMVIELVFCFVHFRWT